MKRIIETIVVFTLVLAIAGCRNEDPKGEQQFDFHKFSSEMQDFENQRATPKGMSEILQMDFPVLDQEQAEASMDLALSLIADEGNNSGENIIISPLSLEMALAIAANGAVGDTRRELLDIIGGKNISLQQLNDYYSAIVEATNFKGETGSCTLANSIWINNGFDVLQSYVDDIRQGYKTGVYRCDMSSSESVGYINDWVNAYTYGHISKYMQKPSGSQLSIINALHISSQWRTEYVKTKGKEPFVCKDGSVSESYMIKTYENMAYGETDGCKMVFMMLRDNMFMKVYLLDESSPYSDIDLLKKAVSGMSLGSYDVDFKMPVFSVETTQDIKDMMIRRGITKMFSAGADFSGITGTDKGLCISSILQKIKLDVDEKGVQGSAATEVEVNVGLPEPSLKKTFHADRPFYFMIWMSKPEQLLFAGKINKI